MPVSLGSTSLFAGSQALTASLANVSGSSYVLDPGDYTVPGGRTLQYRITGTVSVVPGFGDAAFWERDTTSSAYELGALVKDIHPPYAFQVVGDVAIVTSPFSGYGQAADLAGTNVANAATASGLYGGIDPFDVTAPFTVECTFERARTGQAEILIGQWGSSGAVWLLYIDASDKLYMGYYYAGPTFEQIGGGGASLTTATRYDARICFDGADLHLYQDGTRIATTTRTIALAAPKRCWIGRDDDGNSLFEGIVDEVRISDVARSTGSSYTVHTAPLVDDLDTVMLGHFDLVPANLATDWIPVPASAVNRIIQVRNRIYSGSSASVNGTVTALTLEARHVDAAKNTEMVKGPSNPVFHRGAFSPFEWDWGDIAAPPIFLDKHETDPDDWRWVMAYAGNDGGDPSDPGDAGVWYLGLAYKPYDPLSPTLGLLESESSWTKELTNPVMTPNTPTEGYICCNGQIVPRLEGSDWVWYHFYNGASNGGTGSFQIFSAVSTDYGLTWTRLNGGAQVLTLGVGEQGADPQVLLEDDGETFAIYYCRDSGGYTTRDIWRTRSTNPADFNSDNTLFCPIPAYATHNMGTPNPGYVDGELWMTHDSADAASGEERYVAEIRTADDGATFRYRRARLVGGTGGGDWDRGQAFDSVWALDGNEVAGDPIVLTYAGSAVSDYLEGMFSELGEATADRAEAEDVVAGARRRRLLLTGAG